MFRSPHPELVPLLEKHDLSWELFAKKGRLPQGLQWVSEKRRDVITELHLAGTSWTEMTLVTGLSLGAIQRGTRAMWNEASKRNRQESAARVGASRKGEVKPWLSTQLRQGWQEGKYDFFKGRVRTQGEIERQRAALTPEVRSGMSATHKKLWETPEYREFLLAFHRSPQERRRRSKRTTKYIAKHPGKSSRGRCAWHHGIKCSRSKVWTRSSYERAAMTILDTNPEVVSYDVESLLRDSVGYFLPDIIIRYSSGRVCLVEVKASWVLRLPPNDKNQTRLERSRQFALAQGWDFEIWTEKDRLAHVVL